MGLCGPERFGGPLVKLREVEHDQFVQKTCGSQISYTSCPRRKAYEWEGQIRVTAS